jgi:hypothetical protein
VETELTVGGEAELTIGAFFRLEVVFGVLAVRAVECCTPDGPGLAGNWKATIAGELASSISSWNINYFSKSRVTKFVETYKKPSRVELLFLLKGSLANYLRHIQVLGSAAVICISICFSLRNNLQLLLYSCGYFITISIELKN